MSVRNSIGNMKKDNQLIILFLIVISLLIIIGLYFALSSSDHEPEIHAVAGIIITTNGTEPGSYIGRLEFVPPEKKRDITLIMREVYSKIKSWFVKDARQKLTFTQLLPSNSREDIVFTFVPLLHLSNQRRIDLLQEIHFGEIEVKLLNKKVQVKTKP